LASMQPVNESKNSSPIAATRERRKKRMGTPLIVKVGNARS
jgi:hypothetical protein